MYRQILIFFAKLNGQGALQRCGKWGFLRFREEEGDRGVEGQRVAGAATFHLDARAGACELAAVIKTCLLFQIIACNNCRCDLMQFSLIDEGIAFSSYFF